MKWTQKKITQSLTKTNITLENGKKLLIRNSGWYKLYSLYDEMGNWIKSNLRYYNGKQIIKEIKSYNRLV